MWRGAYLDVKLWGANLLKKDRGFFFSLWKALGDWQTARSVNQASLWHLQLGIWKWKPLKSVNLLSTLKNPILPPSPSPPNSCQLWKFKVCAFYHICHSLVVKLWHWEIWLTTLWERAKIEFNSHLSVLHPVLCSGGGRIWARGTPASFIATITILSLVPKFSLFSLSWARWTGIDEFNTAGVFRVKVSYLNHFFSGCSFILNNAKVINLPEIVQNWCCKRLRMVPGKFKHYFMEAQVQQCKVW